MNILILGSGGREHAFAWKLTQSKLLNKLFIAPGNAGTAEIGTNILLNITDFSEIKKQVLLHEIDMLIVGPEVPLVSGIHDFFASDLELKHIAVIGPKKQGAQLEGSKEFSKKFMYRNNIPTAKYKSFTKENLTDAHAFLDTLNAPYVLKADGLAAGKGVLIINDLQEAKQALDKMLIKEQFGEASSKVVIEEYLDGIEMSCFALTDGKDYVILPNAKDYKRIGEGDLGLNTGGMGAISPVPFANDTLLKEIEEKVIKRTIIGLQKDHIEYQGFLFFGLMIVNNKPLVIEYNVRMGDPETEVVLPRIDSDLLALFQAAANRNLKEYDMLINPQSVTTVMLVSGGYPEAYEKGKEITGIENVTNSIVFHAGTKKENTQILSNGGRVLAVTSYGADYKIALQKSYKSIARINFEKMNYRTDIGFDL